MAILTYRVKAEELDSNFIDSIKSLFKNRQISITIEADDEVALQQLDTVLAARQREGAAYVIPGEAFDALVEEAPQDEGFDVVDALKKYKISPQP